MQRLISDLPGSEIKLNSADLDELYPYQTVVQEKFVKFSMYATATEFENSFYSNHQRVS